uniref:Uncharacterized protein n=1 Tax=Ananas comosus var. bracteatus TaxID=296719 RepID=A0A6V7P4H7_ANACO|nr:unnamed protein product [Ananas comosus var. bracteatus]
MDSFRSSAGVIVCLIECFSYASVCYCPCFHTRRKDASEDPVLAKDMNSISVASLYLYKLVKYPRSRRAVRFALKHSVPSPEKRVIKCPISGKAGRIRRRDTGERKGVPGSREGLSRGGIKCAGVPTLGEPRECCLVVVVSSQIIPPQLTGSSEMRSDSDRTPRISFRVPPSPSRFSPSPDQVLWAHCISLLSRLLKSLRIFLLL